LTRQRRWTMAIRQGCRVAMTANGHERLRDQVVAMSDEWLTFRLETDERTPHVIGCWQDNDATVVGHQSVHVGRWTPPGRSTTLNPSTRRRLREVESTSCHVSTTNKTSIDRSIARNIKHQHICRNVQCSISTVYEGAINRHAIERERMQSSRRLDVACRRGSWKCWRVSHYVVSDNRFNRQSSQSTYYFNILEIIYYVLWLYVVSDNRLQSN